MACSCVALLTQETAAPSRSTGVSFGWLGSSTPACSGSSRVLQTWAVGPPTQSAAMSLMTPVTELCLSLGHAAVLRSYPELCPCLRSDTSWLHTKCELQGQPGMLVFRHIVSAAPTQYLAPNYPRRRGGNAQQKFVNHPPGLERNELPAGDLGGLSEQAPGPLLLPDVELRQEDGAC